MFPHVTFRCCFPGFFQRMIALRGNHAACVPRVADRLHPLAAVYDVELFALAYALLAQQRFRPVFLFDAVPTRIVTTEELIDIDPPLQSLRNLNTPEDYQAALAEAEGKHSENL